MGCILSPKGRAAEGGARPQGFIAHFSRSPSSPITALLKWGASTHRVALNRGISVAAHTSVTVRSKHKRGQRGFQDKTNLEMGAGPAASLKCARSGAPEKSFLILLSIPTPLSLFPLTKENEQITWPESILNNFYYTFSVLYTKEISFFFYSDSKKKF